MIILDNDKSSESRELIRKFTSSGYFTFYDSIKSSGMAAEYLDKGEAELFIHIPENFQKNLLSGKTSELQIILCQVHLT